MTLLLASVRSETEARMAIAGGVDLLDLKEPSTGALGALDAATTRAVTALAADSLPVSATIGDVAPGSTAARSRVREFSGESIDIVKVGAFGPDRTLAADVGALHDLLRAGQHLFVVLLLEYLPAPGTIADLARAGAAGVMIDTADKRAGALPVRMPPLELRRWLDAAREGGLAFGLAGSLRLSDLPGLLALGPDFLGFRSALCAGERGGDLDAARLAAVRAAIPRTEGAHRNRLLTGGLAA